MQQWRQRQRASSERMFRQLPMRRTRVVVDLGAESNANYHGETETDIDESSNEDGEGDFEFHGFAGFVTFVNDSAEDSINEYLTRLGVVGPVQDRENNIEDFFAEAEPNGDVFMRKILENERTRQKAKVVVEAWKAGLKNYGSALPPLPVSELVPPRRWN